MSNLYRIGSEIVELIDATELEGLARTILVGAGVPEQHAALQVDLLLDAELRGVPSHGLLRLPRIVERIRNGVLDPTRHGAQTWRGPGFLAVDGETGLGPVVMASAMAAVCGRARETGVALAAIGNSNHIGMLGWYAEKVALAGQVAIVLTTSEALVHPWGGRRAMIGTNPIAIGVPTGAEPYVMDTATSVVSMGEIHDHAHRGAPLPLGWALDDLGRPTTDAEAAKRGAISPFGGPKGYALGLAFELMVTALTGAAIGTDVRGTLDSTEICNKGDLLIVIDGPKAQLAAYLDLLRAAEPAEGFDRVLVPGDRARQCRDDRLKNGVPLAPDVWRRLQALAAETLPKK
ncbi:MAG: Ldh family oxidoreductase [Cypionkella sp.]